MNPMPIVVGSPRSGTTMLRLMLDAHPDLAIPPETGFLLADHLRSGDPCDPRRFLESVTRYPPAAPGWGDFGIPVQEFADALWRLAPFTVSDGFRLFYRMYAARFGKTRWGDKTPLYCRHLTWIRELLPEARFVHIIRDGRDAAVSLREQWFSPGRDLARQAEYWRDNVQAARRQAEHCPHYLEVRFEQLVRAPRAVLERICAFLELGFREDMLRYYERSRERLREHAARRRADGTVVVSHAQRLRQQAGTTTPPDASRIGAWRGALTADEWQSFHNVAGDLLCELGYEP